MAYLWWCAIIFVPLWKQIKKNDMNLEKLADESVKDAINYNKELGGDMTTDQEYWFYTGYQFGVEKYEKKLIYKACEWLVKMHDTFRSSSTEWFVNCFAKAMEE